MPCKLVGSFYSFFCSYLCHLANTLYKKDTSLVGACNNYMDLHHIAMQETELHKGPWHEEEDERLIAAVDILGERRWDALAKASGLRRSGRSCRLRWMNYLRPNLKHGHITEEEEHLIIKLHKQWGNRWSRIARSLPGRTDNEIKNYWRSHLRKKALLLEQAYSTSTNVNNSEQNSLVAMSEVFSASSSSNGECMSRKDDNIRTSDEFSNVVDELSSFGLAYSPYETRLTDWTSNWSKMENYVEGDHINEEFYSLPEWISGGHINKTSIWGGSVSIWDMD